MYSSQKDTFGRFSRLTRFSIDKQRESKRESIHFCNSFEKYQLSSQEIIREMKKLVNSYHQPPKYSYPLETLEIPSRVIVNNRCYRLKVGRKENEVSYMIKRRVDLSSSHKLQPLVDRKQITKRIMRQVGDRDLNGQLRRKRKKAQIPHIPRTNSYLLTHCPKIIENRSYRMSQLIEPWSDQ